MLGVVADSPLLFVASRGGDPASAPTLHYSDPGVIPRLVRNLALTPIDQPIHPPLVPT